MITLLWMLLFMILMNFMNMLNPVKLSFFILITSTIIFFIIYTMSGSMWMPSIFYMLFMGGILMMFMILSSISPNEKSFKNKLSASSVIFMSFTAMFLNSTKMEESHNLLKQLMLSFPVLTFFSLIVLIYFFSFLDILSKEKISMRTWMCY